MGNYFCWLARTLWWEIMGYFPGIICDCQASFMIHSGIKIGMKKIFHSFDEEISRNTWEILEPIVLWKTERIVVMKGHYLMHTYFRLSNKDCILTITISKCLLINVIIISYAMLEGKTVYSESKHKHMAAHTWGKCLWILVWVWRLTPWLLLWKPSQLWRLSKYPEQSSLVNLGKIGDGRKLGEFFSKCPNIGFLEYRAASEDLIGTSMFECNNSLDSSRNSSSV